MGMKHADVKATGEKGLASEWNKNHVVDGDIPMNQNSLTENVIENLGAFPGGPAEGQIVYRTDLNTTFIWNGTAWVATGRSPIGSVLAWLKDYTNTPALPYGWVECDGGVLSDGDSVYDGQVIPDLNGGNRFLRGNSTSGGTGGSETASHDHIAPVGLESSNMNINAKYGDTIVGSVTNSTVGRDSSGTGTSTLSKTSTTAPNNKPPYYEVVWIMRVK